MNGCTTPLIWGWPADFVDVSHLWPLSAMAAVPTDAVPAVPTDAPDPDLRDDLVYDICELRHELKARGYDLAELPDVVKETRAQQLPLDAEIRQLQKGAKRIRKILMRSSSTTPSALLSASAPPQIGSAPPLIAPPLEEL